MGHRGVHGGRGVLVVLLAIVGLTGCGRGLEAGGLGVVPDAETPRPSAGSAAQATVAALHDVLAGGGFGFAPAIQSFQPAQPAALLTIPRSAYQVRLADPAGGVVLIYEFATPEAAATGGRALADYLSSGPGKINFAGDTEFHVAQMGSTVVMTWYSASQSTDPDAARGAFDLVSTVGAEVPVLP